MSMPKRMTVNCSKCGNPISVTAFQSVNTDYADDIAEQIISGDLFNAKCEKCGFISHLEYDMLYHDMKHMAMIWVVHKETPEYASRVAEACATSFIPYKTTRIVEDMNALREKVACLERNRDDRIIELCKVFTAYNLLAKRPEFDFRNAFYTTFDSKEFIFLYDNEGEELTCEFPDKAYEYLNDLYFNSDYAKNFDDNYAIVDYEWAEQILMPLIQGEAEALVADKETSEEAISFENEGKSLFCRKCGAKLLEDSMFCDKCGTKVITQFEQSPVSQEMITPTTNQNKSIPSVVNSQQSAEAEYLRQAQIRQERNSALAKRVVATQTAERKKKIIKIAVIVAAVAIILALIINAAVESAHNSELRNFATETMSEDYTNVYADIVSMEPEYFVYTSYNNSPYSISEVVCKCVTVEGKSIWVAVDIYEYPGGSSSNEDRNEPQYYSKSNPKRIVGRVTTSGRVMDELETKIGDVLVLSVTERIGK